MADYKDVKTVLDWYNPNADSNNEGKHIGFFVNIETGGGTAIYGSDLTPEIIELFKEKNDTIFLIDSVKNEGGKGCRAVNIRFDSKEAGKRKEILERFPRKQKKKTDNKENDEVKDEPQATEPVPTSELLRLEVFGEPVGGDTSGEWNISVELDRNNYPVQDAIVKFRAGISSFSKPTDETGCVEETITVTDNVYGRVVYDSSLSLSGIPIAGPEKSRKVNRVYSKWQKINNFVFLVWTLVLLASFIYGVHSGYKELTTPYAQKTASSSDKSAIDKYNNPKMAWERKGSSVTEQSSAAESFWSYTPFGSLVVWLIWLLIWIILIPFCFYDEIWEGATLAYEKSHGTIEAWTHSRKPFQYTVEIIREGGKLVGKPSYFKDGKPVSEPANHNTMKKKVKSMKLFDLISSVKAFDLASDVGVMLFDRFVLGRLLGGGK